MSCAKNESYHYSVLLVGIVSVAISMLIFYGSYKSFNTEKTFIQGAFGLTLASFLFAIGVGGIFQNEAMTNLTYTYLTKNDFPKSALETSWGQSGYEDSNSYPVGTVKKYDSQSGMLGSFPFTMAGLLPTSAPATPSIFASLNPLLPTASAAISPQAVQSTATASPAQAMQLGGVTTSGLGQSQAVPFTPRPVATV